MFTFQRSCLSRLFNSAQFRCFYASLGTQPSLGTSFSSFPLWITVSHLPTPFPNPPKTLKHKRRSTVQRIAESHMASMGGTLADTVGESNRQRLVWLGLLAMPLLFPIALPGMASAVSVFCFFTAFGLCWGQSVPLPGWLAKREMNAHVKTLLKTVVNRTIHTIAWFGRPRLLSLSNKPTRLPNGVMLFVAGLAMVVPVPIITFDNVLPALAIVLISWGLRLRDGLMLLMGYVATLAAVASVVVLWWGGSVVATELLSLAGFAPGL